MYWKITVRPAAQDAPERREAPTGRFILHRHHDNAGPHWDLRLEQAGHLVGWRLECALSDTPAWALEKGAHPLRWLEHDGEAVREDAGLYSVAAWSKDERVLHLEGREGEHILRAERMPFWPPETAREVHDILREEGAGPETLASLVRDGITARQRAIERFCGLARELDGDAFDASVWRRTFDTLTLDELNAHLRAYEIRFDHKFPPSPTSYPEALPESENGSWTDRAMGIVRDG